MTHTIDFLTSFNDLVRNVFDLESRVATITKANRIEMDTMFYRFISNFLHSISIYIYRNHWARRV